MTRAVPAVAGIPVGYAGHRTLTASWGGRVEASLYRISTVCPMGSRDKDSNYGLMEPMPELGLVCRNVFQRIEQSTRDLVWREIRVRSGP